MVGKFLVSTESNHSKFENRWARISYDKMPPRKSFLCLFHPQMKLSRNLNSIEKRFNEFEAQLTQFLVSISRSDLESHRAAIACGGVVSRPVQDS